MDDERKSIAPMAGRLVDDEGEIQVMRQRPQERVSVTTWSDAGRAPERWCDSRHPPTAVAQLARSRFLDRSRQVSGHLAGSIQISGSISSGERSPRRFDPDFRIDLVR